MDALRFFFGYKMPATLTLKNVPDALYELLKAAAALHRRSLNSEAIVCLESVLIPTNIMPNERLTRARALRANFSKDKVFTPEDIDSLKREGRPC
jgi:antitoxin FitA